MGLCRIASILSGLTEAILRVIRREIEGCVCGPLVVMSILSDEFERIQLVEFYT